MKGQLPKLPLQGRSLPLSSHQPLFLDIPQTIWILQSGTVSIFAIADSSHPHQRSRRHLFNCKAGETLFGTNLNKTQQKLLAIPTEDVNLLQLDSDIVHEMIVQGDTTLQTWMENWINHLSTVFSTLPPPTIHTQADRPKRYFLTDQQTWQPSPKQFHWVQMDLGSVYCMGIPELRLRPMDGPFPLNDVLWVEANGSIQLTSKNAITNPEQFWLGLSQFHQTCFQYIDLLNQRDIQAQQQRFQSQSNLNRKVTTEALHELASTLGNHKLEIYPEGEDALLAVAGAVGKALGMAIRSPTPSDKTQNIQSSLEAIARASRLKLRRVLLRNNWWHKDCGPLVAFTENDHYPVALLPSQGNRYEIFDPVVRTRTTVTESIAASLDPTAYMFYRSLPERTLDAMDVLSFTLKGRKKDILAIALTGIAVTLLSMFTPQATAILLDGAIPDSDRGLLLQVGLGLFTATVGIALFQLSQSLVMLRLETTAEASAQTAIWNRLLSLPVSFSQKYTTGDLLSRVLAISAIRHQLGGPILISLISGLFSLLYLFQLMFYSWKLSLIAIFIGILTISVTLFSAKLQLHFYRPLLELQGDITGQTVQMINGVAKLRTAGAEERAFGTWSKKYSQQVKLEIKAQRVSDGITLFNTIIPTLASGILFYLTVTLIDQDQAIGQLGLSVGTFLAFNATFQVFLQDITELSNTVTEALLALPQFQRLQPILSAKPEVEWSKTDPGKLVGKIIINHASFRYRQDGALVLDDICLYANPGEFIALVGPSGSGKSTLLRLLLGFETPFSGTVSYDGHDLLSLDIDAVRRQLGVVLQQGRLMSASIFENISGGAQITLEAAWDAAQQSGLADDISAMPMGMHTIVSEGGGNISGGQRQRLLIARALALKPRILLFDEATSALDNRTQAIISKSLDQLHVTRIVIAHRLSTIRNADRIYVLQSGRIVQQGSFTKLASEDGLFANLIARQTT